MKSTSRRTFVPPLLIIGAILVITNLVVLDYFVIKTIQNKLSVLGDTTAATNACPKACMNAINSLKTPATTTSVTKESYIPMGQGTGNSEDWTDVPGVQAYIDMNAYKKVKQVIFEATISDPTANQKVWVRLTNATDGRQVWGSDLSMEGAGPTTLQSPPVTLDHGEKLYKVQMKTQLQYPATIQQARVHITTN
jgi:hypothetical protein